MEEDKLCPFCGGEPSLISLAGEGLNNAAYVQCTVCKASTRWFFGTDCKERAIKEWNTRYEPPTLGEIIVATGNER